MRKRYRRWGRTAVAVALTLAGGLDVTPSAASRTSSQAALGTCWLSKLNIGLGEDINAHDYVTR